MKQNSNFEWHLGFLYNVQRILDLGTSAIERLAHFMCKRFTGSQNSIMEQHLIQTCLKKLNKCINVSFGK